MSDGGEAPLAEGAHGAAVRDLHARLGRLGVAVAPPLDVFGAATRAAVESFQRRRGLPITGFVDRTTWQVLVEAGHELGSRRLVVERPMLRGDDVADVQQQLAAMGFDAGRVDGIYGPLTAAAVAEFQRNFGLVADGVVGAVTVEALGQVSPRRDGVTLVTDVRAAEQLVTPVSAIALGDLGSCRTLVTALSEALSAQGLTTTFVVEEEGESAHAAAANELAGPCYLGLRGSRDVTESRTLFYKGYSTASSSGAALARSIASALSKLEHVGVTTSTGMATPVLRETQMTAVVVELGAGAMVAQELDDVATAIAAGLTAFLASLADGTLD